MNDTAVSDEAMADASVDEDAAGWRSAALVLGLAVVAGAAWGGVAAILGYTLAWLAPLLGLAVGVMCRDLQSDDSSEAAKAKRRTVLVGVALLLLSGRVTLVAVGGAYVSTREAAADPFLVFEAALAQAHAAEAGAPPAADEVGGAEPPSRTLREARLQEQAYERVTAMTAGEKRRLVQWYLAAHERAPDRPASPAVWVTWTDLVWWPLAFAAGRWVVREDAIG